MTDKPVKIPGPDHPISIEANPSRVVVKVGGKIIADTSAALTLREASYHGRWWASVAESESGGSALWANNQQSAYPCGSRSTCW
jgi:uncharacterized protein (DUF427 family)